MSEMIVVVRPELLPGFQLAGVEAYPAEDVDTLEELVSAWLEEGQRGLLAIDDSLIENMQSGLRRRLEKSRELFHIAIPVGEPLGEGYTRQHHLAEMIRRAIGFQITFEGVEELTQ